MMAAAVGNQYALGNPGGGRPRKLKSAKEAYEKGLKYIEETLEAEKHLTFTGLCIELGIIRNTFYEYENGVHDTDKEEFSPLLKDLKQRCENYAESRLFGNNPTGAIFALKNYGWKDVSTVENTGPNGGPLQINTIASMSEQDLRAILEIYERAALPEVVDITPGDE